jgi:erythronate-4-phosphate dehydrogenase
MDGLAIDSSIAKDADALLLRTRTLCNEALLRDSRVNFIATATIGFDHIDTNYCDSHAIKWVNAPGCNASSVQQYSASVLTRLAIKQDFSLIGKTIGIIGVGHVGKKVAELARILGMKVLLNDPPRERQEGSSAFVPIKRVLAESDFVTVHVPLIKTGLDRTLHLINENTLELLKHGAYLINSSRGEVVDGCSLKKALSEERLSGVVLDVWENEPEVDPELLNMVTIATPHIAGYSTDGRRNGTVQVVKSLGSHFNIPVSEWSPSGIPEPAEPVIISDCSGQPFEKSVFQAILHTYDVLDDDVRFRSNPGDFETLRGTYPVRREFPAFKVMMYNGNAAAREIFLALGFKPFFSR